MPIYHVEVLSRADCITIYEVEANSPQEAQEKNDNGEGDILTQDFYNDELTGNVQSVNEVKE